MLIDGMVLDVRLHGMYPEFYPPRLLKHLNIKEIAVVTGFDKTSYIIQKILTAITEKRKKFIKLKHPAHRRLRIGYIIPIDTDTVIMRLFAVNKKGE